MFRKEISPAGKWLKKKMKIWTMSVNMLKGQSFCVWHQCY